MKTWSLIAAILLLATIGIVYAVIFPPFPDSGWTHDKPFNDKTPIGE